MDALSEILKSIKMLHCRTGTLRLGAPWGLTVAEHDIPAAYGIVDGEPCWIRVGDRPAVHLRPGDVMLVIGRHSLRSAPEAPTVEFKDVTTPLGMPRFEPEEEPERPLHLAWGGNGPETRMLALAFGLTGGEHNPLFVSLPSHVVLRSDGGRFPWMSAAMAFLTSDYTDSAGYAATARLLAELIFVSIVRSHLVNEPHSARGWLRGLTDPGIARALQALHQQPGHDWSVGSLAQLAGRSRTGFATRFAELVGVTPIDYLAQWRMHLAAERILRSRANITQLAFELGYTSDTAFRTAFKRRYGVAPSQFARDPRQRAD